MQLVYIGYLLVTLLSRAHVVTFTATMHEGCPIPECVPLIDESLPEDFTPSELSWIGVGTCRDECVLESQRMGRARKTYFSLYLPCHYPALIQCECPPTPAPTKSPTTPAPTQSPTTSAPSASPTTSAPSYAPSYAPTASPTHMPTSSPTTSAPTASPTASPSASPTHMPTIKPWDTAYTDFTGTSLENMVLDRAGLWMVYANTPDAGATSNNKLVLLKRTSLTSAWTAHQTITGYPRNFATYMQFSVGGRFLVTADVMNEPGPTNLYRFWHLSPTGLVMKQSGPASIFTISSFGGQYCLGVNETIGCYHTDHTSFDTMPTTHLKVFNISNEPPYSDLIITDVPYLKPRTSTIMADDSVYLFFGVPKQDRVMMHGCRSPGEERHLCASETWFNFYIFDDPAKRQAIARPATGPCSSYDTSSVYAFGYSLAFSYWTPSGELLAVGMPNTPCGGFVLLYHLNDPTLTPIWLSMLDVWSEEYNAQHVFGASIAISSDGSILVVGIPSKTGSGGYIRVYNLVTQSWEHLIANPSGLGNLGYHIGVTHDGRSVTAGVEFGSTIRMYTFTRSEAYSHARRHLYMRLYKNGVFPNYPEIEVYAGSSTNIIKFFPAVGSVLYNHNRQYMGRSCVDGQMTTFAHGSSGDYYLLIDLGIRNTPITQVIIRNREGYLDRIVGTSVKILQGHWSDAYAGIGSEPVLYSTTLSGTLSTYTYNINV